MAGLQALRHGGLIAVYRSIQANPPIIDDPSGEFGDPLVSSEIRKTA